MKILVTGGAGYIGSVCVESLCDSGFNTVVFDNLSEGHRAAVDPRATFEEGCLGDPAQLKELFSTHKPEAVIHFAASALVGESMSNPAKYFRNNVAAGLNLLEASREAGVKKFVFSSTCATYGLPEKSPIREETPQKPVNPYGESKLMMETMLRWFHQCHGFEFVVFRYFNAAGATHKLGESHKLETHLIPNILRVALGQKTHCEIFGTDYPTPDGTCVRDYVHVSDLAEAHVRALQPGNTGFYNLGTGRGYSVREVIRACERASGRRIEAREQPRRAGDPPELVADPSRVREVLGWKPRFTDIDAIVSTAWDWHKRNSNGYTA